MATSGAHISYLMLYNVWAAHHVMDSSGDGGLSRGCCCSGQNTHLRLSSLSLSSLPQLNYGHGLLGGCSLTISFPNLGSAYEWGQSQGPAPVGKGHQLPDTVPVTVNPTASTSLCRCDSGCLLFRLFEDEIGAARYSATCPDFVPVGSRSRI